MRPVKTYAVRQRLALWEAAGFAPETEDYALTLFSIGRVVQMSLSGRTGSAARVALYPTLAALYADLTPDIGASALVASASPGESGLYVKAGASGTGSWSLNAGFVLSAALLARLTAFLNDFAASGFASLTDVSVSVPDRLTGFIGAPAKLRDRDLPWTIHDAPGAAAEKAKPVSTRDYRAILNGMFSAGETWRLPRGDYPLRSGVSVVSGDVPIDIKGESGTRIIPGKELLFADGSTTTLRSASLLQFAAATLPSQGGTTSLCLDGLTFDGTELTAERAATNGGDGRGTATGLSCLDVNGYFRPIIKNQRMFAGRTVPTAAESIGYGCMDSAINLHTCFDYLIENSSAQGFADLHIYDNGTRLEIPYLNPVATTSGSNVVVITATGHPGQTGETVQIRGTDTAARTFAVGGKILFGTYTITRIDSNSFSIVTPDPVATATATGGGVVTVNYDRQNFYGSLDGENGTILRSFTSHCGNAMSFKRSHKGVLVKYSYIIDCINGIRASLVGTDFATYGTGIAVEDTRLINILARPLVFVGKGCSAQGILIQNFGMNSITKEIVNGGGSPIAGIAVYHSPDFYAANVHMLQAGDYARMVPPAGQETRGFFFSTLGGYAYGNSNPRVLACSTDGVHKPLEEVSAAGGVYDITATNFLVAPTTTAADSYVGAPIVSLNRDRTPHSLSSTFNAVTTIPALSTRAPSTAGSTHWRFHDTAAGVANCIGGITSAGGLIGIQTTINGGASFANNLRFSTTQTVFDVDIVPTTAGTRSVGSAALPLLATYATNSYLGPNSNRTTFGTAPPTTGTAKQGDIVANSAAAVGQPKGWRCTVAGSPGTWVSEGNL